MKIRLVGAELFHVDRQARTRRSWQSLFVVFANAPKTAGYESQRTNYEYSAV